MSRHDVVRAAIKRRLDPYCEWVRIDRDKREFKYNIWARLCLPIEDGPTNVRFIDIDSQIETSFRAMDGLEAPDFLGQIYADGLAKCALGFLEKNDITPVEPLAWFDDGPEKYDDQVDINAKWQNVFMPDGFKHPRDKNKEFMREYAPPKHKEFLITHSEINPADLWPPDLLDGLNVFYDGPKPKPPPPLSERGQAFVKRWEFNEQIKELAVQYAQEAEAESGGAEYWNVFESADDEDDDFLFFVESIRS